VKGAAPLWSLRQRAARWRHVRLILSRLNSRNLPLVSVFSCFSRSIVILRGNVGHLGRPPKRRHRVETVSNTRHQVFRRLSNFMCHFKRESSYCFSASIAIAILSVCPSVKRVDQSKTVQARITKCSLSAAWKTLVSGSVRLPKIRRGSLRTRALNEKGVGKICDF